MRLGQRGRVIVVTWEHAGGQPPTWELADALLYWTEGLGGDVNAAGARAMLDGYRSEAGSLPALDLATFRGAIKSWLNYAYGQAREALAARGAEDQLHKARSVRYLLSNPPSRATLQQLLEVAFRRQRMSMN